MNLKVGKVGVLAKKDLFLYSAPAIFLAFAGMPIYIHAPDYFASEFKVPLSLLGLILLLLRVIDAICDPIIGKLSDQFFNQRILIIYLSSFLLVVSFLLLFQPLWSLSQTHILIWFTLFVFLATFGYSTLSINLNTLGGLWSDESHQKTRITSVREGLTLIGLLLAVLMPNILQLNLPANQSFFYISILLIVLMVIALFLFQLWQKKYFLTINHCFSQQTYSNNCHSSIFQIFCSSSRSTRHFYLIYFISMLSSSIPAVLVLFFIRDKLDAENWTGLFLVAYFLSSAMTMPIWNWLSKKKGKLKAWMMAMALAVIVFIWAFFLDAGAIWQYTLICILSGFAFGADLSLPASILADKIQQEHKSKDASLYFGMLSFMAKSALAFGSALSFIFLDWFDFKPREVNDSGALLALSFCYALLPCLIKLIAFKLIFNLTKNK